MTKFRYDFDAIRRDNAIEETIARYIDLKRQGTEYVACCPFHGERSPSFCVSVKKQHAFCMACGWNGDVIDFVAEFQGTDINGAVEILGGKKVPEAGNRPPLPALPPDKSDDWIPILPVPVDAPDPIDTAGAWRIFNPKRDKWSRPKPSAFWTYRDAAGATLGHVIRWEFGEPGNKITPTITYCRHKTSGEARWCMRPFPTPRPLLGLDELAARPNDAVLIVSGEKCRGVAARALPGFVAITWPGGDIAATSADWRPLYGRSVTLWPDLDQQHAKSEVQAAAAGVAVGDRLPWALQSGPAAMRRVGLLLAAQGSPVREVDLKADADESAFPGGWDIADAVADGWTPEQVRAFCRARVRVWEAPAPESEPEPEPPAPEPEPDAAPELPPEIAAADAARDQAEAYGAREPAIEGEVVDLPVDSPTSYQAFVRWTELGLKTSENGIPFPNLDNASRILENHPQTQGRFWFDVFLGKILTTWTHDGREREWSDTDDVRLALWMQRACAIGKMAVGTARDAVVAVATAHQRNECEEWLLAQQWDQVPRLVDLLPLGFGCERTNYTEELGRCWMIGMVARVLRPGCKVDTMPIFEGPQGKGKSTAIEFLVGSRWFGEAATSPTSKDFFLDLQGKMLLEIGEMETFNRAETNAVKRVMSCKVDRYRSPYGRRSEDHPRMSTFAGTTNEDEYLTDPTGGRRFFPTRCGNLNLAWIAANRSQLFAEAVAKFKAGVPWWNMPEDESRVQQSKRKVTDEWDALIRDYLIGRRDVTVGDILVDVLEVPERDWDMRIQHRVGAILKSIGWSKAQKFKAGQNRKCWIPAESSGPDDDLL